MSGGVNVARTPMAVIPQFIMNAFQCTRTICRYSLGDLRMA